MKLTDRSCHGAGWHHHRAKPARSLLARVNTHNFITLPTPEAPQRPTSQQTTFDSISCYRRDQRRDVHVFEKMSIPKDDTLEVENINIRGRGEQINAAIYAAMPAAPHVHT